MTTLEGIPGTISADAARIRWFRVGDIPVGAGVMGRKYRADVADGILTAVVGHEPAGTRGQLLWHVSVSHADRAGRPDRCPNWDELKHAAYRLLQADVPMVLIFPRRSTPTERYVNIHDTTLHLWESENGTIDQ